ncbi:MAG TPA: MFS transporter [Candidatus Limnocylindria bacterium]|nr:MFS transporter [Candidatus Limnocylindria bacterium]
MSRDGRLVFVAKATRTFCYGFLGILFPVYLAERGLDARQIGVAVTLTLLASAAMTFAIRRPAERYGARAALVAQAGLIVVSALVFLATEQPWLIVAAAMVGNLAVGTGETGPFLTLEQVAVTRATPRERLTTTLSFYNLAGYAASALGAAVVGYAGPSPRLLFSVFLLGGLVQMGAYALMRPDPGRSVVARQATPMPSRRLIHRLAALFALDSLAGGFVLQSLIAYWLYTRFGMGLAALGWTFFGAQVLSGLSLLLAARLAPRLGLVNTMVFSHLVSNVLLIGVALAPSAALAVTLLLARHLLSQMDVPTRQSFLMLAVEDHERERAASLTNTSRTLAQSVSPALTGWVMASVSLTAPFFLGGGLKIAYDLMLYATIRRLETR